jgi:hypothetical protein
MEFALRKVDNRKLALLVLCALVFKSIGALFVASCIANEAQSYASHDAMLICRGKSFQWISLSTFNTTGQLKVIKPPQDAPPGSQHIKCVYSYLADSGADDELLFERLSISETSLELTLTPYFTLPLIPSKHLLANNRAPPYFS